MSFPKFNDYGFLPIGTHVVTLAEIQGNMASANDRRVEIWEAFMGFARWIQESRLFVNLFFFGSFFSVKPVPSDIDVALQFSEAVAPTESHAGLFQKAKVKRDYRTDVVFVEPTAEFKKLLPTSLKFVAPKLVMCRTLSAKQANRIALKERRFPQEFMGCELKGVLHVRSDEGTASFLQSLTAVS